MSSSKRPGMYADRLSAARGLGLGCLIAAVLWAVVIGLVWLAVR